MSIRIDPEFKEMIPALSPEEFKQLEENCVRDGIRDALVCWHVPNGDDILIDGHNRWQIAAMHGGIPFQIKRMEFPDRDAVIAWIADNQLGRRNLHVLDREALMAKKREAIARRAKANQIRKPSDSVMETFPEQKGQTTRDIIGKELGVSGRQVDKLHAINEKATPETKQLVREGKLSINQAFNSVHPKRPDPVKQAKTEHAEFQEKKQESVVNMKDAQIDKINREILGNAMLQDFIKTLNKIQDFGMNYAEDSIPEMTRMIGNDERTIYIQQIHQCKGILQMIEDNLWRY